MNIKFRGHTYTVIRKGFIPVGIEERIPELKGAPKEYKLYVNGNRLEGKVALVTGGYRGIGQHIALRLLQDGAKVIITGRNEEQLKKTIARLGTSNAAYLVWDIADGRVSEHFADARAIFGNIDILVNNAGVNKIKGVSLGFESATNDFIHSMNDINVMGTVEICDYFAANTTSGTILNVVSNTAVRGARGIYWMSKWALYSYTKGLAEKLSSNSRSITVNGICPGPTKTDMMFSEGSSMYSPAMANKRMGMPEEIAELAFVQVLSGLNGQTGEISVCDGGESLI